MKSSTIDEGRVVILEPKGSLVGGDETDELKRSIQDLLEKGNRKLIIDLGNVEYLNSSAIGALVSAHTSYLNRQGRMVLCNVNKSISNVFIVTKLSTIFAAFDKREDAIYDIAK
ncbi:MAG: STAS domain-containing protein [Bacteroidetes bacterium]|nr:MAG: STAS domain-containing protein [Bacteroidota bacterium]